MLQWPVFRGFAQESVATSDPNRIVVRCQGPLSLLRDTWDADTDFTGDTDGEAVEAALTASDIDFDPADIQDAGYVLGAIVPIVGTKRTARSQIVKELNRVLGMALVEIGGTVVRFAYSLVPNAADILKTFTRGVDADFWGNERARGPIDDIRNYWNVTGPSYECDGDGDADSGGSCRCVVWAKAQGANVALGSGVRTEPSGESSDVIQDQDLAEWVAERLMQWWNRNGDRVTVQTGYDPEVVIGHTIGLSDPIAGVNLVSDAVDKPYLITRIEIRDFDATYQCVGGVAGDTGTVTSGVEKRCNKSVGSGAPLIPGFTPPTITPPFVPPSSVYDACAGVTVTASPVGGTYATAQSVTLTASTDAAIYYTVDGSTPTTSSTLYTAPISISVTTTLKFIAQPTGAACTTTPDAEAYVIGEAGECLDAIGPDDESDWFTDIGTAIDIAAGELNCNEGSSAYNDAIAIAWDEDWQLTAVVEGSVVGPGVPEPSFGVVTNTSFGIGAHITMYEDSLEIYTSGDFIGLYGADNPFDVEQPMIWTLTRLGAWVFWSVTQGASHLQGTLAWGTPTETGALAIRVLSNNNSVQVSSAEFCTGAVNIGETIDTPTWTALLGSWTFGADDEAHNSDLADADAYAAGHVFDGTERCRWRGVVAFGASDEVICSFILDDTEGTPTGDFCGFQVYVSATPGVDVYTFAGYQETLPLDLSGGFIFTFDADPGANAFRMSLNGETHVYTLGAWPGPKTLHIEHGTGLAVDLDVTDMTIVSGG